MEEQNEKHTAKAEKNANLSVKLVCIINDGTIEDNDFKTITQPFIIGSIVTEDVKETQVEFEYNQKSYNKRIKSQNVKKIIIDSKELDSSELNKINDVNPLDCLINITNRIASKKYFNFVDDGLILLYENYTTKEFNDFKFNALNDKPTVDKEDKALILSSIMKNYQNAYFEEIYMKIIDKNLRKSENTSFIFLSNSQKEVNNPSKNFENLKYFIKNLSLYNKLNYPSSYLDDQKNLNNLNVSNSYLFIDKISSALQLLEIFGCSSIPNKEQQLMMIHPNFLYYLNIYYNKKNLVPRSAKLNILSFNKFILDIGKKNQSLRSFQSFYALLRGGSKQLLEELDLTNNTKLDFYKLLNKNENLQWELTEDVNNYKALNQVFIVFNFSVEEIDYVHRILALVLHIGNLEFDKNSINEVVKVKSLNSVLKVLNVDLKNEKIIETIEKSFLNKIKINTQQKQTFNTMKLEEAYSNLNRIIQDLYEKLFTFITMKINKSLFNELIVNKKALSEDTFKVVALTDISNNSNYFSNSNIFNLFHFYVTEKSFQLVGKNKIDKMLDFYKKANVNNNKIIYSYDAIFENILNFFENPKNGLIKLINEFSLDKKSKETDFVSKLSNNNITNITNKDKLYNLVIKQIDGEYNFNLNGLLESNVFEANYNLINVLDIMINNIKITSEDFLKIFLQENLQNTFFNVSLSNFSSFQDQNAYSNNIFFYSIPQINFEDNLDEFMKKPKSIVALSLIRKFRIESFIENILNKFSKQSTYHDFYFKYEALYDNSSKDKANIIEITKLNSDDVKFVEYTRKLVISMKLDQNSIIYGDNGLIFYTNNVFNCLEDKMSNLIKNDEKYGIKLYSVLRMIKLKNYVKKLKSSTIKIQTNFKKKLVENSKKYHMICQFKIHYFILAKFKRLKLKKMRKGAVKVQRSFRGHLREKAKLNKDFRVDYKNWNFKEHIVNEEKLIKPKYEYGKFNFNSYIHGMIETALSNSNKIAISEFIKLEDYEEIKKNNVKNFNAKSYMNSLCKKVVTKIDDEKVMEQAAKQKQPVAKAAAVVVNKEPSQKEKNLPKKEEKNIKKPFTKNDGFKITNNNSNSFGDKSKAIKEVKKPQKLQEIDKKKTDNLNIIKEEIKAEDSEKREPSNEDKVLKIQGKWKSKRASKMVYQMREKVFIIQRNFRKLLIKKYDLPDNYFYNEVFLRKQLEIFEKNVMENMKVLFPAVFDEESKDNKLNTNTMDMIEDEPLVSGRKDIDFKSSKTKSKLKFSKNDEINLKTQSKLIIDKSFISQNLKTEMTNKSIIHNPYEDGKIHLFANILDIDFMVETDEVYEKLWASSYNKIFTNCINSNAPLQLLCLGSSHTICLSNKGKVYSYGWNNFGQCGVPIKSTIISKKELEEETEEEKKRKSEFSLSKNLKVINKVEGIKIPQIEELMISKSVACGEDHTLLLDHDGEVWCFGINLNGQLGLGHKNMVEKPTKLTSLSKLKIITIKTEGEVNFAVSSFGDAYMWPWNDKNKLRYDPLKISLKNEKVLNISCGNNFVMMLCNGGKVYSMGKTNNYGQLGLGDTNPRYRPTLLEFFVVNQERVTQVSCGYKHTACRTSTGRVYTWGLGVKGQLGHSDFNNYSLPHQIVFDNNQFMKGLQVAAGFRSTFFLLDNRKIYFSGCTSNTFMQNYPILYNYIQKIPEFKNEANYSIVRILTTWTKSFSVLYATIADSSTLKVSPMKLNSILTNLASKWDDDCVEPPYIEAIAGYFSCAYMKKPNN